MKATYFFLPLLLCYFANHLYSQQDSVPVYDLTTLTVSAGANDRLPANAPVQRITEKDIVFFTAESPLAAVNGMPGVRFEERSPGSYRLSIRGSALRAPFGVRNVKVYWNGFPLTEPGGDTPLNVLDVVNMPSVVLYKGPAGSLYGSGTGGAMLINSDQKSLPKFDYLQAEAGSFGYGKLAWVHQRRRENGRQHALRFSHQRTDGYRDHSQFARTTAELHLRRPGKKSYESLDFHVLLSNINYEIPGGLNPEQFTDDPRQARPGSIDTKAGVKRQFFLAGLGWTTDVGNGWRLDSRGYLTGNLFANPFNVDYKRESNLGTGARVVVGKKWWLTEQQSLQFKGGLEGQLANKAAQNFGTNNGATGELNFLDDIDSYQGLFFGQFTYGFGNNWQAEVSLSGQKLGYRVDRSFNAGGTTGITTADFDLIFAPRLSLSKSFIWGGVDYSAFLAYGRAYSPPTLREFRTNEGSLNVALQPERGDAVELGLRRRSLVGFDLDVNVYYQILNESITTFQDSSGVQLFRNSGGNNQFGVEAAISRELIQFANDEQVLKGLQLRLAYTYQNGRYRDYQTVRGDFSEQQLPGLSPRTLDVQLAASIKKGYYARLGVYAAAKTPLNDANEVFADAYTLVRLRLGKKLMEDDLRSLDIYAGVNNLLDESFSLGYDLNPQFGNRYFQPAAGIGFYVGVNWAWQ